jgi:hypothetical protein
VTATSRCDHPLQVRFHKNLFYATAFENGFYLDTALAPLKFPSQNAESERTAFGMRASNAQVALFPVVAGGDENVEVVRLESRARVEPDGGSAVSGWKEVASAGLQF